MSPRDLLEVAVVVALGLLAGLELHLVKVPEAEEAFEIVQPIALVHPSARLHNVR
jgi:hypothetical protein